MHTRFVRSALFLVMFTAVTARAGGAQTCIAIDESHDTLGRDERMAALLMVGKQFELAGHRVVKSDCAATYTVSHIRLGTTIIVTLSGPTGSREATALGLDDLPAVYSQMVRSLTTGQPMGSLAVVDRTNVSASQDLPPRRVHTEGYWYARLGYGTLLGESTHNGATFGFGYRAEFNRLGLDASFLNVQLSDASGYYAPSSSASSLIKLQGLFFSNPVGNRSAYFGGGLGYGRTDVRTSNTGDYPKSGRGAGLQGGLTAGYEIARVTSACVFIQADVTLPFYDVLAETFSYPQAPLNGRYVAPTVTIERQYAPSVAVSVGFGWQRRSR
jgi:hypothetical protein